MFKTVSVEQADDCLVSITFPDGTKLECKASGTVEIAEDRRGYRRGILNFKSIPYKPQLECGELPVYPTVETQADTPLILKRP